MVIVGQQGAVGSHAGITKVTWDRGGVLDSFGNPPALKMLAGALCEVLTFWNGLDRSVSFDYDHADIA